MIGLLYIQAVRLAGFSHVIAVDLDDRKLELAKSMGADHVLNAKNVDVPTEVYKHTNGQGADAALEVCRCNSYRQHVDHVGP